MHNGRECKLITHVSSAEDVDSGLSFCVKAGEVFWLDDFCDHTGLSPDAFDPQEVSIAQDKAARLNPGERLVINAVPNR